MSASNRKYVPPTAVNAATMAAIVATVAQGEELRSGLVLQVASLKHRVRYVQVAVYTLFLACLSVVGATLAYAHMTGDSEVAGYTITYKRAALSVSAAACALTLLQFILYRCLHVRETQALAERLSVKADTIKDYVERLQDISIAVSKGGGNASEARHTLEAAKLMFREFSDGVSPSYLNSDPKPNSFCTLVPSCGSMVNSLQSDFERVNKTFKNLMSSPSAATTTTTASTGPAATLDAPTQSQLKLLFYEYSAASARMLSLAALRTRVARILEYIMVILLVITVITGAYQLAMFLNWTAAETVRDEIAEATASLPATISSTWVLFMSTLSRFGLHVVVDCMRASQAVQRYLGRSALIQSMLESIVSYVTKASSGGGGAMASLTEEYARITTLARELIPVVRDAATSSVAAVTVEASQTASAVAASVATATTETAAAAASAIVNVNAAAAAPTAPPVVTGAALAAVTSVPLVMRLFSCCTCCVRGKPAASTDGTSTSATAVSPAAAAAETATTPLEDTAAIIAGAAVIAQAAEGDLAAIDAAAEAAAADAGAGTSIPVSVVQQAHRSILKRLATMLVHLRTVRQNPAAAVSAAPAVDPAAALV